MRKTVLIAFTLLLAACAGTPFRWEDTAKVQNGMTEAEVVGVLGNPYGRSQSGNITVLTWSFATAFGGGKAVSYRFVDGRVVGVTTVGQPSNPPAAVWGVNFYRGSPVRVIRVMSGSAAEASGIKPGDIILELDGNPMTDGGQVLALIATKRPGDVLRARVERDGVFIDIDSTLRTR